MLQSLFPKENLNTTTLNPISTRKLKSVPDPDPTRYNHTLTRTKPTFGSGMYTSSTQKWEMCYYKSDLNVQILLKSAVKMREMPFQRHKFQKFPEGGMPPGPPQLDAPLSRTCTQLGAAYSSFAPGGKLACYASVSKAHMFCFLFPPFCQLLRSQFVRRHPDQFLWRNITSQYSTVKNLMRKQK